MNKKPVSYLQTDARWKSTDYSAPGEKTTIGTAGCGPTCAAMVIETLTGKTFTPADACAWSLAHGYKAANQGTYYSYFKPQFAAMGIACTQLNGAGVYHNPSAAVHDKAMELLKQGYYIIALMNKGTWTSAGHFILVWWEDGKVRINDPASTKDARVNGDPATFRNEAKYYWAVDARNFNQEADDMDEATVRKIIAQVDTEKATQEPGDFSAEARAWAEGKGIIMGDATGAKKYKSPCTREQMVVFLYRLAKLLGKA